MPAGAGGRARDAWAVEDITNQVAQLVASHMDQAHMAKAMGQWLFENQLAPTPDPMPRSTLKEYIPLAVAAIRKAGEQTRDQALAEAKFRARRIATAAFADKSYSASVRAEEHLAKLEGTHAATVVHLGGTGGGPVVVKTVPQIVEAFDRLIAKSGLPGT